MCRSRPVMCSERVKLLLLSVAVLSQRTDCGEAGPRFAGAGGDVTAAEGRDAALTCRVDNLLTYKVAWLRVDTQTILSIGAHVITKNHRITVTHGEGAWTLGLRGVGPADSGHYMCQVNTEPMMSQLHRLQVVVPPDIDDEASSGDLTVAEGEGLALRCVASGTPPPVITWRREDSAHFAVDGVTAVSKWSGGWLNATARRDLSGAYLCIASNGVPPTVSKRIQLSVKFAPAVRAARGGAAVRVRSAAGATLQCRADAFPPPRLHWTRGEQRLHNGTKYSTISSLRGYTYTLTLMIASVSPADAGAYRCHAENGLGSAQAELFLHMLTTTTSTTTTSTTTTTTTTTPRPSTTNAITIYNTERELEQLHRGVVSGPGLEEAYVVLSQHQMQNLEMMTTM